MKMVKMIMKWKVIKAVELPLSTCVGKIIPYGEVS